METHRDKIELTFAKGTSLRDPSGLSTASLDALVREAVARNRA